MHEQFICYVRDVLELDETNEVKVLTEFSSNLILEIIGLKGREN